MAGQVLWTYPLQDVARGYAEEQDAYCCLFCEKKYQKGRVYEWESGAAPEQEAAGEEGRLLYDASGAIRAHVRETHGGTADYLLGQGQGQAMDLTGISEMQYRILLKMLVGDDDRQIGDRLGIAQSTVRNHRFRLREKEKQAKLFLAMMQSLEEKTSTPIGMSSKGPIEELQISATMIDERYGITEQDREKTLKTYMESTTGMLKQFPAKEKKKIIVLREIIKNFMVGRTYSEQEVNRRLKRIYEADYPTIRRALIEYGFMERSADCRVYHVKC